MGIQEIFKKDFVLFIERESMSRRGAGGGRGRGRLPSGLPAEPALGFHLTHDPEITTRAQTNSRTLPQLSHPGALRFLLLLVAKGPQTVRCGMSGTEPQGSTGAGGARRGEVGGVPPAGPWGLERICGFLAASPGGVHLGSRRPRLGRV